MPTLRSLCGLLALTALGATATAQQIRTTVDGGLVTFTDVQPIMMGNRVMVPVRGVFEHMNAHVVWSESNQTVTAHRGSDVIVLPVNSYTATVNGRNVSLDSPAIVRNGRTLVPLRFLSEALGASVEWVASTRIVEITSAAAINPPVVPVDYTMMIMDSGTVIPFKLNQRLTSNDSAPGDKFTATLDTGGASNYSGLPKGAVLEGHVDVARAKSGTTPGVLGLAFDRVRMPDGQLYGVSGSLIGLDSKYVDNDNGRLVAKSSAQKDNLKYVGYGAGGGALVALLTDGNVLSNSLIGAALGFLYGEIQKDPSKANNVALDQGSLFGVRLTNDLAVRIPVNGSK